MIRDRDAVSWNYPSAKYNKQKISSTMKNEKEYEVEDDIIELEPVSRKDFLKIKMTVCNFLLLYEHNIPDLHNALQKIQDKI